MTSIYLLEPGLYLKMKGGHLVILRANEVLPEDFKMECRSRCPPKDLINAILSFGYTVLFNEIYSAIIAEGLHPYISVIHESLRNGLTY